MLGLDILQEVVTTGTPRSHERRDPSDWLAAAGRASRGQQPNLVPLSHSNSIGMTMARRSAVSTGSNLPRPRLPTRRPFSEKVRAAAERRQERSMERVRSAVILAAAYDPGLREAIGGLGPNAGQLLEQAKKLLRQSELGMVQTVDFSVDPAETLRRELNNALESGRSYLTEVVGFEKPDAEEMLIGGFGSICKAIGMDMDDPNNVAFRSSPMDDRAKMDAGRKAGQQPDLDAAPTPEEPDPSLTAEGGSGFPAPSPFGPRKRR